MIQLFETASRIQKFIKKQNWSFCFIGGLALLRWGAPRLTNDVDLTLLTGFGSETAILKRLYAAFDPRISDAIEFSLRSRVALLTVDGVGVDISLGALYFEESAVNNATEFEFADDISLRTCSAEDLIVYKGFAARDKDWMDIKSVTEQQENLNWNYIFEQLTPLVELKEEPEILTKLSKLRDRK